MKIKILILNLLFFTALINLIAQETLHEDTFIVVSEFQPILTDAVKIKENPVIQDTSKLELEVKYSTLKKSLQPKYDVSAIKPARIKGEPLVKLYKHYLKAGIGMYTTPFAEYRFMSKRNKKWLVDINAKHLSSKGLNKIDYAGFSNNQISTYVKRADKDYVYDSKIYFHRDVVHYYGFPTDSNDIVDKDNLKQRYNVFGYSGNYANFAKDTGDIAYQIGLNGYYLYDLYNADELNIVASGYGEQFTGTEWYQVNTKFDYYKPYNSLDSTGNGIFSLEPKISTIAKKWRLRVGLGIFVDAGSTALFHFYPQAEFKYNVVGNIIIPYVGITGNIKRNSIRSLFTQNNFITSQINFLNTNEKLTLYGGIRGQISKRVSFNAKAQKQTFENLPLFVINNDLLKNKFTVIYDKVGITAFGGQLTYENRDKLKILISGRYAQYSTENELKAWNMPTIETKLTANYNLQDKIIAHITLFYIGKRYAKDSETITTANGPVITEKAVELNGYIDANIGFEYRYTKRLSAYINFNNIAATKYYKWQQYKVQGFGILGGFSYSF